MARVKLNTIVSGMCFAMLFGRSRAGRDDVAVGVALLVTTTGVAKYQVCLTLAMTMIFVICTRAEASLGKTDTRGRERTR